MYSFSPLPCDLSVQRRGKEVVHSDVTPVRGLSSSTACHTFERVGKGEGDLHWGRSYNFCRITPEQFCSHGSQRPMKPLSKEYIIGNAQALGRPCSPHGSVSHVSASELTWQSSQLLSAGSTRHHRGRRQRENIKNAKKALHFKHDLLRSSQLSKQ